MALSDIKSEKSVISAIDEFNEIGKEQFLTKYGFREAQKYFLIWKGKRYPSKAIAGVAHKFEFPEKGPLKSSKFNGGENTVKAKLESLGFEIEVQNSKRITNQEITGSFWVIYVEKDASANFSLAREKGVWGAHDLSKFRQTGRTKNEKEGNIQEGDTVLFVHDLVQNIPKEPSFPRLTLERFQKALNFARVCVLARVVSAIYEDSEEIWHDSIYPARFNFSELA
jgi:hypothetical protein